MRIVLGVFQSKTHCNQWRQLSSLNGTDAYLAPVPILLADGWKAGQDGNKALVAQGKPRLSISKIIETYGVIMSPKDLFDDMVDGPERLQVQVYDNYGNTQYKFTKTDVDQLARRYPCNAPGRCFLCQHSDGYAVLIEKEGVTVKGGVLTPCLHTEFAIDA